MCCAHLGRKQQCFCDMLCIVKHTNKLKCLRCGQVSFHWKTSGLILFPILSSLFSLAPKNTEKLLSNSRKDSLDMGIVHCRDFNTANSLLALLSLCIVPWECEKQEMPWMTKRKIYIGAAVYRDKPSLSHPGCNKTLQVYLSETFISHEHVFLKGRFDE